MHPLLQTILHKGLFTPIENDKYLYKCFELSISKQGELQLKIVNILGDNIFNETITINKAEEVEKLIDLITETKPITKLPNQSIENIGFKLFSKQAGCSLYTKGYLSVLQRKDLSLVILGANNKPTVSCLGITSIENLSYLDTVLHP